MKIALLGLAFLLSFQTAQAAARKSRAPAVIEATEMADESAPIAPKLVAGTAGGKGAVEAAVAEVAPAVESSAVGSAAQVASNQDPNLAPTTATQGISAAAAGPTGAELAKLPENQIPVLTGSKDAKHSAGENMSRLLITLGVMIVGLGAALFGLKRYAAKRGVKKQSTKIQILTQQSLGPKKNLAIIQVAGEAILIGVTDHNISMIKTLALIDDEFPEAAPRNFNSELEEYEEEGAGARSSSQRRASAADDEDFTVQGLNEIRDRVSGRIKGMKNL